jgi:hypothetical protein
MLENISITNDLIILGIFALSILMHIFLLNQQRFYALLFASYVSYLLVLFFPFNSWFASFDMEKLIWLKVWIFLGGILVLFVIFNRSSVFLNYHSNIIAKTIKSIIFGILNVGIILSLLALLLPIEFLYKFSDLTLNIFNSPIGRFVCLTVPIVILIFLIRIKKKGPGRPRVD